MLSEDPSQRKRIPVAVSLPLPPDPACVDQGSVGDVESGRSGVAETPETGLALTVKMRELCPVSSFE